MQANILLLSSFLLLTLASAATGITPEDAPREVRVKFYMLDETMPHAIVVIGDTRYEVESGVTDDGRGNEEPAWRLSVLPHRKKPLMQKISDAKKSFDGHTKSVTLNTVVGTTILSEDELFEMARKVPARYDFFFQNCVDWTMAFTQMVMSDSDSQKDDVGYDQTMTFLQDEKRQFVEEGHKRGHTKQSRSGSMFSMEICRKSISLKLRYKTKCFSPIQKQQ